MQRAPQRAGISIETRARFGFTAAPGMTDPELRTTDDGRIRLITQHLPPAHAARLFDAQAAGATEQPSGVEAGPGTQAPRRPGAQPSPTAA
ncbi:hypothetical protein AB0C96_33780 [Streptomyces sp. NPDC048506]|uniref:hypothetical protein n=1 Tax=Streptomyces sp. NPDC048506 TaxID=3155028 RepID=UPI003425AE94